MHDIQGASEEFSLPSEASEARDDDELSFLEQNAQAPSRQAPMEMSELDPDGDVTEEQELHALQGIQPRGTGSLYNPYSKPSAVSSVGRNTDSKKSLPCFNMMTRGECLRPECAYSHEPRVLQEGAEKMAKELTSRPWSSPTPSRPAPTIPGKFGRA